MFRDWFQTDRVRSLLVTGLALITAVLAVPSNLTPTTGLGDTLAEAPGRLVAAVERIAEDRYLGFDTNIYPGDRTMKIWADDGTYDWVGYYLPAPCHKDRSWSGKRDTLINMGWGLAVVYVGQQVWKTSQKPKKGATCSNSFISGNRGIAEGHDAIGRIVVEGFPHGSVIFLDIERMDAVPRAMREYYRAWTARVVEDGRFRPAYYTHSYNANAIYRDVKQVLAGAGISGDPPFWIASVRGFAEDKHPTEVGHTFAKVWQGVLDIVETHNGVELPIDINVAHLPSPSEDYPAAE